ncbi:hypothetical protein EVAR_22710_1 [Eumeta japonica]|uniref:Uncharacterized protein n=1 Tax=Eumeta variegata TaxID=151549 RepID=A0A4C1USA9_EUMVA|nr:hypothetical protein EVAR_22710_1 [Eumeta japonica]
MKFLIAHLADDSYTGQKCPTDPCETKPRKRDRGFNALIQIKGAASFRRSEGTHLIRLNGSNGGAITGVLKNREFIH